jgi:holin-like protein
MVRGFVVLLLLQLAGEVLSRGLKLPVPGPVLGLVFLFLALMAYQRLLRVDPVDVGRTDVARVAEGLLQNLALLFVPAGVGVVQQLKLLSDYGVAIAIALIGSTAVTLAVTVLVFTAVARRTGESEGGPIG